MFWSLGIRDTPYNFDNKVQFSHTQLQKLGAVSQFFLQNEIEFSFYLVIYAKACALK